MVTPYDPMAPQTNTRQDGVFGFVDGISRSSMLLGDMWGLRPFLARYGATLTIQETSEILGNATGGIHKGAAYDGLTQATLQVDTQRAFGLKGGTFNVSGLQIHGRNLSADNLQSLQTASGIEADRATRLWELWYQQKFLDEDRLDIKIGQQSIDQEFMTSQNSALFVNTMFGWPMLPSADMPDGGPAYPLSALGVRVRARPTDSVTVLAGVFNGRPTSKASGDSQKENSSGTSFPLNGGALIIGELQYAYPSLSTMVMADESEPLAHVFKLGAWYDTERFADQRYDQSGLSLADPASDGNALTHRGNMAVYAVADQMVWRSPEEPDRTANVFMRVMGTPDDDRNVIDFSLNAGITIHEPILHRDDDTFGIGMGYARVSSRASGLDRDNRLLTGAYRPVRSGETFVEITYQYQVTPWWQVQPDIQYVFNVGGGLPDPNQSGQRIGNETIFGARTNILF
ncbi:MAG: carbohydrate porin [Telmatospirillum sp.]|nr:carbohydrate porin [Telmatospirillum sp.]